MDINQFSFKCKFFAKIPLIIDNAKFFQFTNHDWLKWKIRITIASMDIVYVNDIVVVVDGRYENVLPLRCSSLFDHRIVSI